MTTSDYLESLQDDLDTIVNTLELEEGSTFSDIAAMVANGEINKGGSGSSYTGPKVYKVNSTQERTAIRAVPGDICLQLNTTITYPDNENAFPIGEIHIPQTITLTQQDYEDFQHWIDGYGVNLIYGLDDFWEEEDPEDPESMIGYNIHYELNIGGGANYPLTGNGDGEILITYEVFDDSDESNNKHYEYVYTSQDGLTWELVNDTDSPLIFEPDGPIENREWETNSGILTKFIPVYHSELGNMYQYNDSFNSGTATWKPLDISYDTFINKYWTIYY